MESAPRNQQVPLSDELIEILQRKQISMTPKIA